MGHACFDPSVPRRKRNLIPDGFKDCLLALRAEVVSFRNPVACVHGDSHFSGTDGCERHQ
jgi:hypothetical protein